jgi:septal ring factor EnvC (AmiA/AmiB activator)
MTAPRRRHRLRIAAAAAVAAACALPALTGSATGDSVTQLKDKLGSTQSQLNSNKQHAQSLSSSVSQLNSQVSSMASKIALMQQREADAHGQLITYDDRLAAARLAVGREILHLHHVRRVLAHARRALADELESQYEQPQQSLVSVLVSSKGFQQLLDTIQYLSMAKRQEQRIITSARVARRHALLTEAKLTALQKTDATAADDAQTQTDALAGMDAYLNSQQSALSDERSAQSAALSATQAKGAQLQAAVATIQKQEEAAEQAAQTISYSNSSGGGGGSTTQLGSDAGWAIPYKIVLCESGGANLPPNSAGASGYYQILPSTWSEFGGTGPAAYLASKAEQDAVASRIWNGGAGASNWSCSAITGIT